MTDQLKVERCHKLVRVVFGGEFVASSANTLLVWERPYYPTYYFPEGDVNTELLAPLTEIKKTALGEAHQSTVKAGGREASAAAYTYPESPFHQIRHYFAFVWRAMDHWFEEDEEVYVHPRDPYTRVDTLASSRRVRIEIDGLTVADSSHPTLLFETGLPVRYYLPKTDVRLDLLEPSDRTTECPYKGTAEYSTAHVGGNAHENVVWSYPFPTLEAVKIAGLMCFYNERTDIYVDDELEERPVTAFS
ncbi:MAG TPA: DUF427 domain-containing protein [Acidimicrobiia bacterium]|nr:DUF427 domain-containing protein [Acidimicrobiia bacterium]